MSKDLFFGLLLFLTLAQWIIYAKVREWWRSRHPEPKQGKPVDRVLYHLLSDWETPWDAGTSWEKHGRGYIVALQRQGLDELLDERDVSDHKPAYTLGYCVREQEDRAEIERLTATIRRREQHIDRLRSELEEERQRKPELTAPRAPAPVARSENEVLEAWYRSSVPTLAEFKARYRSEDSQEQEATTQPLTASERASAMVEMKEQGRSYKEIAEAFGLTEGGVKGIISKERKARRGAVETVSEAVS